MRENEWFFADVHNAIIRQNSVNNKWRKYDQPWDDRHLDNNIEPEVVDALEKAVKDSYARTSHRFYALKAKLMGQDHLDIYDRNINILEEPTGEKISWSEAKKIVLEAFASFSPETHQVAEMFFDNGWIDAQPSKQKQDGAFAHPGMARTDHPFVMVNFDGTARDVATLAHELGHGVHQYLEAQNDKAVIHTPLTLAETASVFAEMLTFKSLLAKAETDDQRRKMLFEKINDMINAVIRQISFYDFEKRNNTQFKESNRPLLKGDLGKNWVAALQGSYGSAIPLKEEYGATYGYIGHFVNTPFYVYAYAFGDSLVNALYQVYEEGQIPEQEFKDKYAKMLAAGGTYTLDDLKTDFGLDVRDPSFWNKGLNMIEGMIDELEVLCAPLLEAKLQQSAATSTPEAPST
jgi:oligoendopeptidase F